MDQPEFSTEEKQRATIAVMEAENRHLRDSLTYAQALLFRQAEMLPDPAAAVTDDPDA